MEFFAQKNYNLRKVPQWAAPISYIRRAHSVETRDFQLKKEFEGTSEKK